MNIIHVPVLLDECLEYLVVNKSGKYFDATVGFGGHSKGILSLLDHDAELICTDVDKDAFNYSKKFFSKDSRVKLYNFNFNKIDFIAKVESIKGFDGIIADLGVSSFQLDNVFSGFTFRQNAKLDLRFDKSLPINASDIINTFEEEEIGEIFRKYGEERNSKKIAKKICEKRVYKKIVTTSDLLNVISEITSPRFLNKTLARVFQALRIYVNDELNVLKDFIQKAVTLLVKGGRIVILTYHSLEDRIVKESFKYEALDCICPKDFPICKCDKESRLKILTLKPVVPSKEETAKNFRARSAKLRAAEKI